MITETALNEPEIVSLDPLVVQVVFANEEDWQDERVLRFTFFEKSVEFEALVGDVTNIGVVDYTYDELHDEMY